MDFSIVNIPLLIAAGIALIAISVHIYTFEKFFWPGLKVEGFPSYPLGPPVVVMTMYRTVWHFFTVNLLLTIILCAGVAFGTLIPYGPLLIIFLMIFWVCIVLEIFIVAALSMKPDESYVHVMIQSPQWVLVVSIITFMYLGVRP